MICWSDVLDPLHHHHPNTNCIECVESMVRLTEAVLVAHLSPNSIFKVEGCVHISEQHLILRCQYILHLTSVLYIVEVPNQLHLYILISLDTSLMQLCCLSH